MEREQEIEWAKAQCIRVSVDLVEAAKSQLSFLAAVDRNRFLYESPALEMAIHRYNAYWLPLLAKHMESPVFEDALVVPLDCEWIWHCHRLNPIRYKSDCLELFGKILDNLNVVSSVQGTSKSRTKEIWSQMYPQVPYELDYSRPLPGDALQKNSQTEIFSSYDLVSAVKRQASFFYQVSRPHMYDDQFLQEAVARYKGFLHLINTNRKKNVIRSCVPTYDIDLIWHSHQLHPISYCNDLYDLLGKVLEHDDTDSNGLQGKNLDTGFSETTKQFEEAFGLRYWKAGAIYRGTPPTPVTQIPFPFTSNEKKLDAFDDCDDQIQLPEMKSIEVLLEFADIKNLPVSHNGKLHVSVTKKPVDKLFNAKRSLSIQSVSGEKQVAYFQCEPNGEFLFELIYELPSDKQLPKSFKQLGSCSLSMQDCLASRLQHSVNEWLLVTPAPDVSATEPILLHVYLSFTPPVPALQSFHLVGFQPLSKGSFDSPIQEKGKSKNEKNWAYVVDCNGNNVLSLQKRILNTGVEEVCYTKDSGEKCTIAVLQENDWIIRDIDGPLRLTRTSGKADDDYLFKLVGHKMVRMFSGRRLEYEPQRYEKETSDQFYMTAVEFSTDYPYGKSVALIDFKNGTIKVREGWITGIMTASIMYDVLRKEGGLADNVDSVEKKPSQVFASPGLPKAKGVNVSMIGMSTGGRSGSRCFEGCDVVNVNMIEMLADGGSSSKCRGDCDVVNVSIMEMSAKGGPASRCFGGCDVVNVSMIEMSVEGGSGSRCFAACDVDNVSMMEKSIEGGSGSRCFAACDVDNVSMMEKSIEGGSDSRCFAACDVDNVSMMEKSIEGGSGFRCFAACDVDKVSMIKMSEGGSGSRCFAACDVDNVGMMEKSIEGGSGSRCFAACDLDNVSIIKMSEGGSDSRCFAACDVDNVSMMEKSNEGGPGSRCFAACDVHNVSMIQISEGGSGSRCFAACDVAMLV